MKKLTSVVSLCLLSSLVSAQVDLQLTTVNSDRRVVTPENSWSEYISAGDVLRQYAPVTVKSSGMGSSELLNIRGQSKGLQFYLDGAPLPMDVTGFTDLSLLSPADIDRIEIQKGFAASSAGGAGAVYIYTKTPAAGGTVVDADAQISAYKTALFNVGAQTTAGDIPVKINYSQNQSDGFQDNSAFDKKTLTAALNLPWDYAPRLSFLHTQNFMELPGGTYAPVDAWNGSVERAAVTPDDWQRDTLNAVSASRAYGRLSYAASYANLNRSSLSYGSVTDFKTDDAAAKLEYALFKPLTLGLDWHYSALDTDAVYFSQPKFHYNIYSGYADSKFEAGFLDLNLSARYDKHDYWDDNFSYKARAATRGKIKFFAGGSSAVMFPSIADYDENPDSLKPEQNNTAELGAEGTVRDFSFKTSVFYSEIRDKVAVVMISAPPYYKSANVGRGRNAGFEAEVNYALGDLRNSLIYNFSDYQVNPYGGDSYERAQFAPQNIVRLNTAFTAGKWSLLSMLNWTGAQYSDMDNSGVRLPAYVDWTVSVERKLGHGAIYAGVRNLLNQRYANNGMYNSFNPPGQQNILYPNPPVTFFLGIKHKLFD